MSSTAYQNPTIIINNNVGNVKDSYNQGGSDEARRILEWLSPLVPRERHQAVSEGRMDGVGDCLLRTNEFKEWHRGEDQAAHPVLFCYGDPGVGKTYLSSLVIDTLCDAINEENMAVACVYCDFHAHKEQSATSVLAVLLKQLVAAVEPIREEVKEAFERAKKGVDGRTLRLPEICAMLIKSLSSLRRAFICIDALDEFPTKHRPELWESLQHVVRECPNTRLFITGRSHILEEVNQYFPACPNLIPIKPTEEDIRGYITMRLKKDSELDAMDVELEADIHRIIPDKISGAFLLVSLIIDAVLEGATIHQRRKTLHKMANGFGLDDAYSTTLSRIGEQKGDKGRLGMEALMWISRSERPLKADELCHALAVEVGATDLDTRSVPSIRTLLRCALGLVTIDEQTSTVRLVHFTLQEYLETHANLSTPRVPIAEICLTYLNFQSVCNLPTSPDSIPSTKPFLHYASCYWGIHAKKEMTEGVKYLALRHLEHDANHISASILLREENVDFLSFRDRYYGRHPDLQGFTGLHCIAYTGITEIAIEMVKMKRGDLNGRDSNGATPLLWAIKHRNSTLAKLFLEQGDIDPTLSDNRGLTPLAQAAKTGQEGLVKLLLERRVVDPNSVDEDGRTPLSHAANSGHEGAVKILLERGDVNPDSSDKSGQTPLSFAARSGREDIVKILLERGDVNPDSSDKSGWTPLSFAAGSGREDIVKILLERGDVNPDSSDEYGRTPLSFAAGSGSEGIVKILLERGDVNPDSSDKSGRTPLLFAVRSRSEGIVKALLKRGDVNPDSPDKSGRTPLSFCAESGTDSVVRILLARGDVKPDSSDWCHWTPLSFTAESGPESVVKILLDRCDVNPDSLDEGDRTPLSYAAESGPESVVKMLLDRGDVNPDSTDEGDRTPLSYAAESGREAIVKILLGRRDVNPNSLDKSGQTPLSYAARSGHEGVVKILLQHGDVNPDLSDGCRRTPLSHAAGSGHEGVVKILLNRGDVNPESSDKSGRSPLSFAAQSGHEGMVEVLLERGDINPNLSDDGSRTPLSYAARYGHQGVVEILLERSDVNPDSSDVYGSTPLSSAARFGYVGVVKILLERGDVNPDSSGKSGRTPLSYAARNGHESVVKILLDSGNVDPHLPDVYGSTPLSLAAGPGRDGVLRLLSRPWPFTHETLPDSDLTPQIAAPSLSPPEKAKSAPVSPPQVTISDIGHLIAKLSSLSLSA